MTAHYELVTCPVAECPYDDTIRAVAAHVNGADDSAHDWDRLGYDGPQEYVKAMKTEQRADRTEKQNEEIPSDASTVEGAGGGDGSTENDDFSGNASSGDTGRDDTDLEAIADELELDLTFVREAVAVTELLSNYNVDDISELDPFRLANLYILLSNVSSSADDSRKTVRDQLLEQVQDDRSIESDFGGISRQTNEIQHVRDDETVAERLETAGIDPTDAMSFDESKLGDLIEAAGISAEDVFETEERVYIRRTDFDQTAVEEMLGNFADDTVGE